MAPRVKKSTEEVLVVADGKAPVEDFDKVVRENEAKVEVNGLVSAKATEAEAVEPREDEMAEVAIPIKEPVPEDASVSFFDTVSKPQARMVKVKTSVDHSCTIGGVRYFFTAGKQQTVPEPVKEILLKAGLLSPL